MSKDHVLNTTEISLDKKFLKSRLRDSVFSSYKDTVKTIDKNVPKLKFDALKIFLKNEDIVAQKAHKRKPSCHFQQKRLCA